MLSSLILTNCFFFALCVSFVIYLLGKPKLLTYKKGIPICTLLVLIILRLIFPGEFPFTKTILSEKILPFIMEVGKIDIIYGFSLKEVLVIIWFCVSLILLVGTLYKHLRFTKVISLLPSIKDKAILEIFSDICKEQGLRKVPKIVCFNNCLSPMIVGIFNPIIVMPGNLTKDEVRFTLLHELEHFKHRHLLLKAFVEIAFILYWWHPLILILKLSIAQALELQADAYVKQNLSEDDSLSYIKTLVDMATKRVVQQSAFSMAFTTTVRVTRKRMCSLANGNCSDKKSLKIRQNFVILASVVVLLCSVLFTFEAYHPHSEKTLGTKEMDPKRTYFLELEDGTYELHINDNEDIIPFKNIPDELSGFFKVYKK